MSAKKEFPKFYYYVIYRGDVLVTITSSFTGICSHTINDLDKVFVVIKTEIDKEINFHHEYIENPNIFIIGSGEYIYNLLRNFKEGNIILEDNKKYAEGTDDDGGNIKKYLKVPRKNLSAYFHFNKEQRPLVQGTFIEIPKIIAAKYKSLTPTELLRYQDMADKDEERYKQEMKEFMDKESYLKYI